MTTPRAPFISPTLSASPANRTTAAPTATMARSTTPASTRRLSSFGPRSGAGDACAIAFITPVIGTREPEIERCGHDPGGGAGRGHRHGFELLAPRRVRLRARHPLVEPR